MKIKRIPNELIMQTVQDGLFAVVDEKLVYANHAFVKMLGYESFNDMAGKYINNFIWPDDIEFVMDRHRKRMSGEKVPNEYEFRLRHKNGYAVYVIMAVGFAEFDNKKAAAGTMKDITERINSELKIKNIESSYKTLLELCPDPIIVSDFDGNILMHNHISYELHEPTSSDFKLIGTNVIDYVAFTEEDRNKMISMCANITNHTKLNVNFRTQKGRDIPFELHTTTVYDSQGSPTCQLSIGRDMSQIKEYENKLKQHILDKELMIREIHHRIKNNLQQIYSLLGLQVESEFVMGGYADSSKCFDSGDCFGVVHRIISDARRRVLAISIVHEMFYKYNTDCIEFSLFLKELIKNIKNTYDISNKNVTVNVEGDDFELCLDYIIPCGLIANEIIINAYKYAFEHKDVGNININLIRNNGLRTVIISDNGIGMEVEDILKMKTLGLSLINGLVEQIGGTLKLESSCDKGTKYTIIFKDKKYIKRVV